jgi:DHA3 family tetracycline resistance protein-like MFS transporter
MTTKQTYLLIRSVMGIGFFMMFTAAILYRIDIAKLEVYQLILLGTALEVSIFLFEVPTGIVADLKSRKLSIIIGLLLIGIGFIIEALTIQFWIIFIAQIIWGIGLTFISGALDSWVTDELENKNVDVILVSGHQYFKFFQVVGILLAGIIGMISIRSAIYLSGSMFILIALIGSIFMKEEHFNKQRNFELSFYQEYIGQIVKTYHHIKQTDVLRMMFIVLLFFGLYSEGIDRTYELHILDNLGFRGIFDLPDIWIISIINALGALLGFLVLSIVKRFIKQSSLQIVWVMDFTILMILGVLGFAFFEIKYLALMAFLLFRLSREGMAPLINAILIKNTPYSIKASVLSGFGQLDAIGQLLSGFIMVGVSVLVGIKGVYMVSAMFLTVPLIMFMRLRINQLKIKS